MSTIEEVLQEARGQLIDLSLKNRFLNFKPTKRKTIKISSEETTIIFQKLVSEEKNLKLCDKETFKIGTIDNELKLVTDLDGPSLLKSAFYVNRMARSIMEEQGYTGLYLALPFLRWTESQHSESSFLAPLILIPVEIRLVGAQTFGIVWTKEEVQTNFSLELKLSEQGISLPNSFVADEKNCFQKYINDVEKKIRGLKNWKIENLIYLDFYNFTKIAMYRDLDPKKWLDGASPHEAKLLKLLFGLRSNNPPNDGVLEDDIDKLNLKELYHVADADPSQIAAIEDAKNGHNLVVHGPPGTGKSQTIVNLIAELLANGKTVLFVSEKLAALEVVKKRLDQAKIGDFCLELHSQKANKKAFVQELERVTKLSSRNSSRPQESKDAFAELETLRNHLNEYAVSIGEKIKSLGLSMFDLFCKREKALLHFQEKSKPMPEILFEELKEITSKEYQDALRALENLFDACPNNVNDHPWKGCVPKYTGQKFIKEVGKLIDDCLHGSEILESSIESLNKLGFHFSMSLKKIDELIDILDAVERFIENRLNIEILSPELSSQFDAKAKELLQLLEVLTGRRCSLEKIFKEESFDSKILQALEDIDKLFKNYNMLFHPIKHYRLQKKLIGLFVEKPKITKFIKDALNELLAYHELRNLLRSEKSAKTFFGNSWKGDESDPVTLKKVWNCRNKVTDFIQKGCLDKSFVEVGLSTGAGKELPSSTRLKEVWHGLKKSLNLLLGDLGVNSEEILEKDLQDLANICKKWKQHLEDLHGWYVFQSYAAECRQTLVGTVVALLEQGHLSKDDLIPAFEANFASAKLEEALKNCEQLTTFTGDGHQKKIQNFRNLDLNLIEHNRARLRQKLLSARPKIPDTPLRGTPEFILKNQFSKKKKLPIRKLFSKCGDLILRLKPCVMMSPLSVAQFLDPGRISFDVVVFDEASQIKPADAFGALLRAGQLIVMGDSQQLPPTNFFDLIIETEEEDTLIKDLESLLDICKSSCKERLLKWHYRSEHESLITVSNSEFYKNQLLIYPSPNPCGDDLGLHFIHIKDGVYDVGRSRRNMKEAAAVAEHVFKHFEKNGHLSLGVGTFSSAQRDAVLDEIDRLLSEHPEMQHYLSPDRDEPFFVKNLETIQGDERDVMFISIGYGFDNNGKLNQNFGPLNKIGGERRLNVLITRARKKCVVFSNFRGSDLNLNKSNSQGLTALKIFLEYAETGVLHTKVGNYESDFEESVARFLIKNGFKVDPQVGCIGYRIDLAIPHPDKKGRYILGIECDGAKYHSSRVARERDRLREQMLTRLGWKIERVWSTDWYLSRKSAKEKLLASVRRAVEEAKNFSQDS